MRTDYFRKEKANREKAREGMGVSGDLPVILWPARIVNPDGKPTARKKLDTLLRASALVKTIVVIPTYWDWAKGEKKKRDDAIYDHPTPPK